MSSLVLMTGASSLDLDSLSLNSLVDVMTPIDDCYYCDRSSFFPFFLEMSSLARLRVAPLLCVYVCFFDAMGRSRVGLPGCIPAQTPVLDSTHRDDSRSLRPLFLARFARSVSGAAFRRRRSCCVRCNPLSFSRPLSIRNAV